MTRGASGAPIAVRPLRKPGAWDAETQLATHAMGVRAGRCPAIRASRLPPTVALQAT